MDYKMIIWSFNGDIKLYNLDNVTFGRQDGEVFRTIYKYGNGQIWWDIDAKNHNVKARYYDGTDGSIATLWDASVLKDDLSVKDIEWPDRITASGMYRHMTNDSTKLSTAKYLPYINDGNTGDGWTIIAVVYSTRYIGLYASQINGSRGGIGRLDTTDKSMSWIKFNG